jgi:hypothetical protein
VGQLRIDRPGTEEALLAGGLEQLEERREGVVRRGAPRRAGGAPRPPTGS